MPDHLEQARKVLHAKLAPSKCVAMTPDQAVEALDRAGLLRTDLHERALRACEEIHEREKFWPDGVTARAAAIGRDSLALKQPKPRWTVDSACYLIDDRSGNRWLGAPAFTEAQARAVADALNKLEGGER